MGSDIQSVLRALPKIDAVLARPEIQAIAAPRWAVVEAIRSEVAALRRAVLDGKTENAVAACLDVEAIAVERRAAELSAPSLCRVINATGVVLHTNLGRAPLAAEAMARAAELASGYSNLEYDLDRGKRGSRHGHLVDLVTRLTGAEDAAIVNNNAGAVMLCLAALAHDGEVVVSRGELIEIGGSFRIPDVMRLSGAHLVEAGTTNKTRAADYRAVAGDRTAMFLKVHRSNFAIVGFTEEISCPELGALGSELGVTTMMDLGSGALVPAAELAAMGLGAEPSVAETVAAGIDVVTFSGDKLLGGPQAGIICGRREHIARVRKHPLMRALRPDKLTICALEATLEMFRDRRATSEVPAMAMLSASADDIRDRAEALLARLADEAPDAAQRATIDMAIARCESRVGGGALPLVSLPSWGIGLCPGPGSTLTVGAIEAALRRARPAVIGRITGRRRGSAAPGGQNTITDERLILDLRTVLDRDIDHFGRSIVAALAELSRAPAG